MRILLIGAGGVGSAAAAIAARREFFDALVVADYDRREPSGLAGRGDPRIGATAVDASSAQAVDRSVPRARDHARAQRGRSAIRDADLRWRIRGRGRLSRHGDVTVAGAPGTAVPGVRSQARRRAVRCCRPVGASRAAGPGRHRSGAGTLRCVRPLRRRRPLHRRSTRSACATAPTSSSTATTSRRLSRSGPRSRSASTRR